MRIDGTDVVTTKRFYKDVVYTDNGGEAKSYRAFVDWGTCYVENYVMYGSPYQLHPNGAVPQGLTNPDVPILVREELVSNSGPTDAQVAVTPTANLFHYKPGINI